MLPWFPESFASCPEATAAEDAGAESCWPFAFWAFVPRALVSLVEALCAFALRARVWLLGAVWARLPLGFEACRRRTAGELATGGAVWGAGEAAN